MTRGRIPIKSNYTPTDLVHLNVDPYGGAPSSQATPAGDFFKRGNELQGLPYNIKHYGAVGDETTDNIVAIQAALDDASAADGGTVYVPQGRYGVSSAVILPKNVSLRGSNNGAGFGVSSIEALDTIAGGLIQLIGDDATTDPRMGQIVEDLYVGAVGLADYGIEVGAAIYTNIIKNVKVLRATAAGIYFRADGCWGNTIENTYVGLCQRGIDLRQSSNAVRIINSCISANIGAGIYMDNSTMVSVLGCTIEQNGTGEVEEYGIQILGGSPFLISGCYFEGNGVTDGRDIITNESPGAGGDVNGGTVVGCYFNGLDTETKHALDVSEGTVTVVGGLSRRHTDTTTAVGVNGVITNYGCFSEDPGGFS